MLQSDHPQQCMPTNDRVCLRNLFATVQPVDVNKLVKGRPLDNMEFMQWFKSYWDSRLGSQHLNYDAVGRRNLAKSGAMKGAGSRSAAGAAAPRRAPSESQVRQRRPL